MACVVLASDSEVQADILLEFAKEKLAAYKYPRRIEIVESLPLGPSGKVLKRELVLQYERADPDENEPASGEREDSDARM
jgi:long-chain acyl-CoA synthetase